MKYAAENSPEAKKFLDRVLANDTLLIRVDYNSVSGFNDNTGHLIWNPSSAYKVTTIDGTLAVVSPALVLLHEIFHWSTAERGEADEIAARNFEKLVARELGEPVRSGASNDTTAGPAGIVTVSNATAHTESGKWVAIDGNMQEIMGPNFDPNNPVLVIGTDESHPSNGSGNSGGGGGGGGGTSTGGSGSGTGTVIVTPLPPPDPPIREIEMFVYDIDLGLAKIDHNSSSITFEGEKNFSFDHLEIEVVGIVNGGLLI